MGRRGNDRNQLKTERVWDGHWGEVEVVSLSYFIFYMFLLIFRERRERDI